MRRFVLVAVVTLSLVGCGAPTAEDVEGWANETTESIRVRTPERNAYTDASDQKGNVAQDLAERVGKEVREHDVGASASAEDCSGSRCKVTMEGLLKGSSDLATYKCETAVTVTEKEGESTARRGQFTCREAGDL